MTAATGNERYFVSILNQARENRGLDPLQLERHLNSSSDRHSNWMLAEDVFSHTGAGGSSPTERMLEVGFDLTGSWGTAENLAYVTINNNGSLRDEVRSLFRGLMHSPAHRDNILDGDFDLVGIGLKVGWLTIRGQDYNVLIATQNFAHTAGDYILDIAPGVAISTADQPDLYIAGPTRSEWSPLFNGDLFRAQASNDITLGTAKNDDLRGTGGADDLRGRDGADWIVGGSGSDTLRGQNGNDNLLGSSGHDFVFAGAGDDRVYGGHGNDIVKGGSGNDNLLGNAGHDRIFGARGIDHISGGPGRDHLVGGSQNDLLSGGNGADRLNGGRGSDTIMGGSGNDILAGSSGADRFIFRSGDGIDRVYGYEVGVDRILIEEELLGPDVASFVNQNVRETSFGVVIHLDDIQKIFIYGQNIEPFDVTDDIFLI